MAVEKAARLAKERDAVLRKRYALLIDAYRDYISTQAIDTVFPPVVDIAITKVFQSLIVDTPENEILTEEDFVRVVVAQLPIIMQDWRKAKDDELVEILKKHVPDATVSHLHLATTVFKCDAIGFYSTCCNEPLTYPRVFAHRCTSSYDVSTPSVGESLAMTWCDTPGVPPVDKSLLPFWYLHAVPWNMGGDRISFSEVGSRNAKAAVKACGLNPDVTTVEDMNSLDPMLECRSCYNEYNGRVVMRWTQTVCLSKSSFRSPLMSWLCSCSMAHTLSRPKTLHATTKRKSRRKRASSKFRGIM